eukprot:360207-Chlamydomonas_euryale.AAC.14
MMQAEKENIAVEKLSALMPQLGPLVRVAALKECIFDVEMAVQFLRRFSTENEEPLKALQKVSLTGRAARGWESCCWQHACSMHVASVHAHDLSMQTLAT